MRHHVRIATPFTFSSNHGQRNLFLTSGSLFFITVSSCKNFMAFSFTSSTRHNSHQQLQNSRHVVLHANTYSLLHLVYSPLRQAHRDTRNNSHRLNMCRGGLSLDVTMHRSAGTIFRNHVRRHAHMYRQGKRHHVYLFTVASLLFQESPSIDRSNPWPVAMGKK